MDDNLAAVPKPRRRFAPEMVALTVIFIAAFWLRLRGLDFGLPSLYDQDEPIFVLTALKLLRQGTMDPGWFGHPGTTTIYSLALIYVVVFGIGLATGRFADADAIGKAIYSDPSVVALPGRYFILACALATIGLTFVLARRLFGARAGLIAAALLCVSPVHIKYSQIIRTDMHETVFLLLSMLSAVNIVRRGRTTDYVWAAIWLGVACATKWPAATVGSAIAGAAAWRVFHGKEGWRGAMPRLISVGPLAVMALLIASPYVAIDFPTVVANLSAEARAHHPGATGHGFWGNASWYLAHPLRNAMGFAGLALAVAGLAIGARRSAAFGVTLVPFVIVSLIAVSIQALVWERWMVPLLPFLAIAAAVAVDALAVLVMRTRRWQVLAIGAIAAITSVPLVIAANAGAAERRHDTRAQASAWARANIRTGSTVLVEQLAFDLFGNGWRFLYPVGDAGCIDVAVNVRAKLPYSTVERWRGGRAVIDIGTIAPAMFATCRADYAIFVNYDRYLQEPQVYAAELRIYRALLARGQVVATFAPQPGKIGGPVVRVVKLQADLIGQ